MQSVILDPWMAERLQSERNFMRSLVQRATTDPAFRASDEFAHQVADTDETFGFAVNWVADGQPDDLCERLGQNWGRIFQGSLLKRLTLRLQLVDILLEGFQPSPVSDPEYDVFISHASEDEAFVGPHAEKLVELDLRVWYDGFELKAGDSLREQVEFGLRNSKFAIVVLSPAFCSKTWTQSELSGLVARQVRGKTTIIPVWYKMTIEEVTEFSPILADRIALDAAKLEIDEIGSLIAVIVRKSQRR
jgi:hypothetical protein